MIVTETRGALAEWRVVWGGEEDCAAYCADLGTA